ncbi:hypothetical protein V8J88_23035 [Massilia sp. W12]|uniref:hypothetical protein n=1 Tax=Massilia sp. W12 TaxID=3126507 RepID=UPI0030D02767
MRTAGSAALLCVLCACASAPVALRSQISIEHGRAQLQAAARLLPAQQHILQADTPALPQEADDTWLPRLQPERLQSRLSLQADGQSLRAVLDQISRASGLRFHLAPEVNPRQPMYLQVRDSTVEQILAPLLQSAGLQGHAASANEMLLYPASADALKRYVPLLLRSFSVNHSDGAALVKHLHTLLPGSAPVFDARSNLLRLRASPDTLESAQHIVNLLEQADAVIELELALYEVSAAHMFALGLQASNSLQITPGAPNWRSGALRLQTPELSLQALQSLQHSRLLQRSQVRLQAQQSARIHFGDQLSTISDSAAGVHQTLHAGWSVQAQAQFISHTESRLQLQFEYSAPTHEFSTRNGSTVWRLQSNAVQSGFTLPHGTQQILAWMEQTTLNSSVQGVGLPLLRRNPQQARQLVLVLHSRLAGV